MANNVFTIDDGTRELTITNTYGQEIGKIHVRTGDIGIIDRFNEFVNRFDKIIEPLSNVSMNSDGTSSFESDWETIKGVAQKLIDELNAIFDTNDIGLLFSTRNAFSTINGVFYVEKVIEMLGNVVSLAIADEAKQTQKRVSKYTKDIHRQESQPK